MLSSVVTTDGWKQKFCQRRETDKEQDEKITKQLLQAMACIKTGKTPGMLPFECNFLKYAK